jgi:hypothetical protein
MHLDFRPHNIMVSPARKEMELIDYGLSVILSESDKTRINSYKTKIRLHAQNEWNYADSRIKAYRTVGDPFHKKAEFWSSDFQSRMWNRYPNDRAARLVAGFIKEFELAREIISGLRISTRRKPDFNEKIPVYTKLLKLHSIPSAESISQNLANTQKLQEFVVDLNPSTTVTEDLISALKEHQESLRSYHLEKFISETLDAVTTADKGKEALMDPLKKGSLGHVRTYVKLLKKIGYGDKAKELRESWFTHLNRARITRIPEKALAVPSTETPQKFSARLKNLAHRLSLRL